MRSLTEHVHGRALDAGMASAPDLDEWWIVAVVDADLWDTEVGPAGFDSATHPVAGSVACRWDEGAGVRVVTRIRDLANEDGASLLPVDIRSGVGIHETVGAVAWASAYWLRRPSTEES